MSDADVIAAIKELGQTLRAEIQAARKEAAHDLTSFRLMVEEEFAGIRRDNASLRRALFEHEQKIEALEKKAG